MEPGCHRGDPAPEPTCRQPWGVRPPPACGASRGAPHPAPGAPGCRQREDDEKMPPRADFCVSFVLKRQRGNQQLPCQRQAAPPPHKGVFAILQLPRGQRQPPGPPHTTAPGPRSCLRATWGWVAAGPPEPSLPAVSWPPVDGGLPHSLLRPRAITQHRRSSALRRGLNVGPQLSCPSSSATWLWASCPRLPEKEGRPVPATSPGAPGAVPSYPLPERNYSEKLTTSRCGDQGLHSLVTMMPASGSPGCSRVPKDSMWACMTCSPPGAPSLGSVGCCPSQLSGIWVLCWVMPVTADRTPTLTSGDYPLECSVLSPVRRATVTFQDRRVW